MQLLLASGTSTSECLYLIVRLCSYTERTTNDDFKVSFPQGKQCEQSGENPDAYGRPEMDASCTELTLNPERGLSHAQFSKCCTGREMIADHSPRVVAPTTVGVLIWRKQF